MIMSNRNSGSVPDPSDRHVVEFKRATSTPHKAQRRVTSLDLTSYQSRWTPAWGPGPGGDPADSTQAGENLVQSMRSWLAIELELHDARRNRPGIPEAGAEAWFGRKVVQWAHKLPEHAPGDWPRGSFSVYRHLAVPVPWRTGGFTCVDPVILRDSGPDVVVRIDANDPRDHTCAINGIERAASAGAVAVFISWRRQVQFPTTPVHVIDLADLVSRVVHVNLSSK
jgi:hypothetical protein